MCLSKPALPVWSTLLAEARVLDLLRMRMTCPTSWRYW
jgi:hypothetical protein